MLIRLDNSSKNTNFFSNSLESLANKKFDRSVRNFKQAFALKVVAGADAETKPFGTRQV
jgi:hypothetical protein